MYVWNRNSFSCMAKVIGIVADSECTHPLDRCG